MIRYIDKNGGNAITHYENAIGGIKIRYASGREYLYTNETAGIQNLQRMRQLAASGKGLSSFIQKNKPGHRKKR